MTLRVEGLASRDGDRFKFKTTVSFPSIFGWNLSGIGNHTMIPVLESEISNQYNLDSIEITSVKKIGGLFR